MSIEREEESDIFRAYRHTKDVLSGLGDSMTLQYESESQKEMVPVPNWFHLIPIAPPMT